MPFEAQVLELLSNVPDWLSTIIISALPVLELRGAIPIAIGMAPLSSSTGKALIIMVDNQSGTLLKSSRTCASKGI